MSKKNSNKISLVSRDFVQLVLPVLREHCTVDSETGHRTCLSRPALAALLVKKSRKDLPTKNERILVTLLEAAEEAGQLTGFESRLGRNGGLFKSEEKVVRKPKKESVKEEEVTSVVEEVSSEEESVEVAA